MERKVNFQLRDTLLNLSTIDLDNLKETRVSRQKKTTSASNIINKDVLITETYIPGLKNSPKVRTIVYKPIVNEKKLPGLLWIHGGGYVLGNPERDNNLCIQLATEVQCVVVSVDYRLAPESPFPSALNDCYATLVWMSNNSREIGINNKRIAVAGASAGGGLATSISLLARDLNGPKIVFQMPLYPMIDDRNATPSSYEIIDKRVWNRHVNIKAWRMYLGQEQQVSVSEYAAPARAIDLSNLPPTYTFVGELDPFRDETINYIKRLSQAGVPTEFHLYPGCFHRFEEIVPHAEISKRAKKSYIQALKRFLQENN